MNTTTLKQTKRPRQLTTLENEVLNNKVNLLVGVFNSRDGDVTDGADEGGKDFLSDVVPEVGLEGKASVLIEENVLGELLPVLAESNVDRVLAHRLEPGGNLVEECILVAGVLEEEGEVLFSTRLIVR